MQRRHAGTRRQDEEGSLRAFGMTGYFLRRREPRGREAGSEAGSEAWSEARGGVELMGGGGGDGYAHVLEFGAGAAFFFGAGVALDDFAKLLDAGIFLA